MRRISGLLAGLLFISGIGIGDVSSAQDWRIARSDIASVLGYYGVTNGISDRRLATAWGNATFESGLGTHAEIHFMDREETAAYLAGGLSVSGKFGELRGWLGTSTDNWGILPEFSARLEATYRSRAELGLVIRPAVSHRVFRNGAEDSAAEIEIAKYASLPTGMLIFTAMARGAYVDPGGHASAAFGAGVIYSQPRKFSVGVNIEGGRAAYDGLLAPGLLDERYISIRPTASIFLTDNVELFGLVEHSSRESHSLFGGHVGLKIHLD